MILFLKKELIQRPSQARGPSQLLFFQHASEKCRCQEAGISTLGKAIGLAIGKKVLFPGDSEALGLRRRGVGIRPLGFPVPPWPGPGPVAHEENTSWLEAAG